MEASNAYIKLLQKDLYCAKNNVCYRLYRFAHDAIALIKRPSVTCDL